MPNYKPVLWIPDGETTLRPLLNVSGNVVIYDADLYPSGPPPGCCCPVTVDCCFEAIPRTLFANLQITPEANCPCLDNLNITLTYGTTFSGAVDQPVGTNTPPCWSGAGVVGWEGETTSCGNTVKMQMWCCTGTWHMLLYCNDVAVIDYDSANAGGSCDPFSQVFTGGLGTRANTNCGCLVISSWTMTVTE